jgi:iron complex transport system ATP-binding protein
MAKIKNRRYVLEAIHLGIGYSRGREQITIAKDIEFRLTEGELIGIVGANGIGKSTMLRTLGKVQAALSGNIQMHGKDLESYNSLELATLISIVLTEPIASKNMTVEELVALGRQPYTNWIGTLSADDRLIIEEALAMVTLETLRHKKCYELSDGQLQRVMISRALAQDTKIILLDEPTTHLDLYHKVQILKLLKGITQETKKTVVFTTHEIDLAIQLCDKIILLDTDKVLFGTPCELIEQSAFDNLFPRDAVSFDPETGTFRINK